jgi:hypothetical protein
MGTECEKCKGVGLISLGSVPHDLSVGQTVKCDACGGRGYLDGDGAPAANPAIAPVQHPEPAPYVAPTPAFVEPVPAPIFPKVGDACVTADNQDGTIQAKGEGFVCVPNVV